MKLAFVVNPVQGGWSPLAPDGWGGGEEVATLLTAALARRGHAVTCFYDGPACETQGVNYLSREAAPGMAGQFDVGIYFKVPEAVGLKLAERQFLLTDQERLVDPDPFVRIVVCSEYLKRFYASLVPRSEERLAVIPYGYEAAEIPFPAERVSSPLVLHASSPDRGLEQFLTYWPAVLRERPEARLLIAYGWDLFDKYGGDPTLKRRIQALLAALPEDSWEMRRLPRAEMHAAFYKAGVWAYYCTGGEQFCLTAIKAQVAGCVPVVKPWGAMHETVRSGIVADNPTDFVQGLIRALDPTEQATLRTGITTDYIQTWDQIAEQWETLLKNALPVIAISETRAVPDSPAFGRPGGWNAPGVIANAVQQWFSSLQVQRPWIDPTLGIGRSAVEEPRQADAVVVGWSLEDGPESPAAYLTALKLPPAMPVLLVSSIGTWRAGLRRRQLTRRCLAEVFGHQPECLTNWMPVDGLHNGLFVTTFRLLGDRLGARDVGRVRWHAAPRQTLAACFIARNSVGSFGATLDSLAPVVDQVCVVDTGSTDHTRELVADWGKRTGITTVVQDGTSPRWCWDCVDREHDVGEMHHGHRVAGFETPRNQSLALAQTDWILWLDTDEQIKHSERLNKYLRPNVFVGYGVPQHHHSVEPPEARKTDFPVRLFRRQPDVEAPLGWFKLGEREWKTYGTGLTARFSGIVHEHPGSGPLYTEGMGPVVILSDVHISHDGYLTEEVRRSRFVRNWPLMVADRAKYPGRRLGRFLWLRDLTHQMRYLIEVAGNRLTSEAASLALESIRLWNDEFRKHYDAYAPEAMGYAAVAYAALSRGMEVAVSIKVKRPEVSGDETVAIDFGGRFEEFQHVLDAIQARAGETARWTGLYQ